MPYARTSKPASAMAASLRGFATEKLARIEERGLLRRLEPSVRGAKQSLQRGKRHFVSFSDNDYLGLSQDPRIKAAAAQAAADFGAGAGASRLVTGDHPLLSALEARLAAFKGYEAAAVFGSGYLANLGTVPVLAERDGLVLVDSLAHACLHAGAALSAAKVLRFDHNDCDHLDALLSAHRRDHPRALVLTDGVFSMDGDQAPLKDLAAVCERHGAWLMVDDAHGLGVLGGGQGTAAAQGVALPLAMGTLSKALGSYGGYVCADRAVIALLHNRARSFVYTTGLPPAAAGAALAALAIVEAEPERCARPLALARRFCAALGLPAPQSAVVPIVLGAPESALAAQATLETEGFLAAAIRPPTVPDGTARLRLSFSAAHDEADVDRLAAAVGDVLKAAA